MQFPQPIVRSLVIYNNDGTPAVSIGPGPMMTIFSSAANSGNIDLGPDQTTGFAVVRFWDHDHVKFAQISSNDLISSSEYPQLGMGPYNTVTGDFAGGNHYAGRDDFGSILRTTASVPLFAIFGNQTFSGGGIFFFDHSATATNQAVQWNRSTGYLQCIDNTWFAVTKLNGWVDLPGWNTLAYQFQPDGTVRLRGACRNGLANSGTQIGGIGDGNAWPRVNDRVFPISTDNANGFGTGTPRLQITSAGDLFIYDTGFGPLYFDGITWDVT
jgi:hypothetical protein